LRFLIDECTGTALAAWLAERGHEVFSVFESARGATDDWILQKARDEEMVLVTNDKDFGEKIFRSGETHCGVVLLRLSNQTPSSKIEAFERVLELFSDQLTSSYMVVGDRKVRITRRR
jgi:predicted nuclease of predicted toxin-antitoxin system